MKLSKRNIALIIGLCFAFSLAFSLLFTKAIEQASSVVNIPQMMNYQGRLTDNGNPITGSITVTFSIYDVLTGGSALWVETQNVTVNNGIFNVLLGSMNPLTPSVFSSGETYLGIRVEGDSEVQPRQRLVSVAYAFFANDANTVNGQTPAEILASHTQHIPHMDFISSTDMGGATEVTAPAEAKIAILNLDWRAYAHANVGWVDADDVFILLKEGASSLTINRTVGVSLYTVNVKFTLSWSDNLIQISTEGANVSQYGATAYFYR